MKKLSIFLALVLLSSIISPFITSLRFEKKYTYSSESVTSTLHFQDAFAKESSLSPLAAKKIGKIAKGAMSLSQPKDMFTLKIEKTSPNDAVPEVTLTVGNEKISAEIDQDGDERMLSDQFFYTKPIFTEKAALVAYNVLVRSDTLPRKIELVGLDTSDATESLAIDDAAITNAEDATIISRKDWGADETLRYADHPTWQAYFKKQAADTTPKSDATIAYEKKVADINAYLKTNFPDKEVPITTVSEENGHKLIWPIEKTRIEDKIVIHHSAEDNKTDKDDLALLRGVYYYHTMVR